MSSTQPPVPFKTPAPLTAWQSMPQFIRFAVWVWAIATVACVGLGWLVAAAVFGLR